MSRPLPARLSPRAGSGVRRTVRRLRRSPAAAHLRASTAAAFWPAVILSGLLLGLLTRDVFITWDGVHNISTYGANR
ncbi:hypothetical protein [Blastococcus mobilis]|uniref:Uncharacterized protein n=1 Tax=Blastococcus mobilis TaxID=1938746 RepID=A0A238VEC5_9ACTN|nr:hypothetical protein [Blastococcus mobilis]SNR32745.1 hypothetical protein SAMN06272737_10348 [Blastococcus mobilis]